MRVDDPREAPTAADSPSGVVGPVSDRDPSTGRFLPGNVAALVTGERSRQFWLAADAERRSTRDALLRQRGFTSEPDAPAALWAVADGAAQALLIRDSSFQKLIQVGGPTTTHDRRRDVLRVWENASDRALRHLQAIGLEPREKNLADVSPADWIRSQERHGASGTAAEGHPGDEREPGQGEAGGHR